MKKAELERIEERLLEERRERIEILAEIDERFQERLEVGDDDLTKYPLHMADEGTDTMEEEKELLLAHQEGEQLLEIDASLRLLYRKPEEFGICENCGTEIGVERLEMVPWAKLCIECKREAEKEPGGREAIEA
ncbi:MAG: TraR/DksA family transcriptional regulator [Longimicrobiales bacterium]|nr:TraR/DksA family transcriptional regulator [Longimicrobiales bacterium]